MWDLKRWGNRIACTEEQGNRYTYADLDTMTGILGNHIPERCLVFALTQNSIGSLLGYVTFLNKRIVPLMLDAKLSPDLFATLLERYKPDYLWMPEQIVSSVNDEVIHAQMGYALVKRKDCHAYPLFEELALLLTTSGSTGSPKLVRQSYANIEANTKSIVEYLGIDSNERAITTLPMNYVYGLSIINTHLWTGARIVLSPHTIIQRDFWEQFKREETTSFGGVPYTYEMLDKLRFYARDLPSLRTMTQAGGKLRPDLHQKFSKYAIEKGIKFFVMYGAAEATSRMGYLPADKALDKCGAMGIAIPGGKFTLLDENSKEITETDVAGELCYEGQNVTLGYARCGEDLIKSDERNGRLLTGDLATRDADGFYTIVGRKNRFLKIYGHRVGLGATEQLVNEKFPTLECACSGKDDALHVFITEHLETEVKNFLVSETKLNQAAFHVHWLQEIPKNNAGKTLYAELEKYFD